eukprot:scaffold7584_cov315-Pinguiococcus_pyrenoidosus.AAC.2
MSPGMTKGINVAIVPVSAALAGLVPPFGIPVNVGLAAATAFASNKVRKKITSTRKDMASVAMAEEILIRGVENTTPTILEEIGEKYGLDEDELRYPLTQLLRTYFNGIMSSPIADTKELAKLVSLKDALGIDGETAGEAVYQVACDIYAKHCNWSQESTLEDPDSLEKAYVDKFLWLAQRFFVIADSEEAATYEMSRITKIFDMSDSNLERRLLGIATPFYEKAIEKAMAQLGEVKHSALQKASERVGLPPYVTNAMHADKYRAEVKKALAEGEGRINDEASEQLSKLAKLLNVPDSVVEEQNAAVTRPILRELMEESLNEIADGADPQEKAARVLVRMTELQVPVMAADRVIADAILSGLSPLYVQAVQKCRIRDKLAVVTTLRQLLERRKQYRTFLENMRTDAGDNRLLSLLDRSFRAYGEQAQKDTVEMYATFVQRTTGGTAVMASKEQIAEFEELSKALGLAEDVARSLRQSDSIPRLEQTLDECFLNGTFTAEQRDSNIAFSASLGVPLSVYVGIAKDKYMAELQNVAGGSTVFGSADRQRLHDVRVFLDLTEEEVEPMHREVNGRTYKKALLESFGVTGQISKEVQESLDILRQRLLLSEKSAVELRMEAIRERLKPMVDGCLYEFEEMALPKDQLAARRNKDAGEDVYAQPGGTLGLKTGSSFFTEALTLVEFFEENELEGVPDLERKTDDSELQAATGLKETNPLNATTEAYALKFALNATGMVPQEALKEMYKCFVVGAFEAKKGQKERMEKAQPALAGILGLDTKTVQEVHSTIGSAVYGNYISNALQSKPKLDQQDFMFLGSMRAMLGLPEDEANELLKFAKVGKVRNEMDKMMARGTLKGETVEAIRMAADGLGIDLVEDLRLDIGTRKKLFIALAESVVEDFSSDSDQLQDLSEEFLIPDDDAEKLVRELLVDRCRAAAGNAFADARAGRTQRSIAELERLLRLARFAPDVVEINVSRELADKVINMYQNAGPGGTGPRVRFPNFGERRRTLPCASLTCLCASSPRLRHLLRGAGPTF